MKRLGYINEYGSLITKKVQDIIQKYRDDEGNIKERTISVEEQEIELLKNGWKPVDCVDESLLQCDVGYHIKAIPYDAGDHIAYKYEKRFDIQKVRSEIQELKERLSAEDYKIVKCYEASLLGNPLPYDISKLHTERQAQRDRINELETKL